MRMGLTQIQTEPQTIEMALHGIQDRPARLARMSLGLKCAVAPAPDPVQEITYLRTENEELRRQLELARQVSTDPLGSVGQERPYITFATSIRRIIRACAIEYGVTSIDIVSARRTLDVVRPRQIAAYLAKKLTGRSLPAIGRVMGGRDHTTILASCRKIEKLMAGDPEFSAQVATLKSRLEAIQ